MDADTSTWFCSLEPVGLRDGEWGRCCPWGHPNVPDHPSPRDQPSADRSLAWSMLSQKQGLGSWPASKGWFWSCGSCSGLCSPGHADLKLFHGSLTERKKMYFLKKDKPRGKRSILGCLETQEVRAVVLVAQGWMELRGVETGRLPVLHWKGLTEEGGCVVSFDPRCDNPFPKV